MCKLSGFYRIKRTKDNLTTSKINFSDLIASQAVGNSDAAGLATVRDDNQFLVYKQPISGIDFVASPEYAKIMDDIKTRIVIGHCRFKTQGDNTNNKNNHPLFTKDGIIVIHNGVIRNDAELFKKYNFTRDAEVDSEILPQLIAYHVRKGKSTRLAIQETLKECTGSIAMAVLNCQEPDKLYLVRREGNLNIAYDKKDSVIYFATSETALDEVLKPNKLELGYFEVKQDRDVYIQNIKYNTGLVISKTGIKTFTVDTPATTYWNNQLWCVSCQAYFGSENCTHVTRTEVETNNKKKYQDFSVVVKKTLKGIRRGFSKATAITKPSQYSDDEISLRIQFLDNIIIEKTPTQWIEYRRLNDTLNDRLKKRIEATNKEIDEAEVKEYTQVPLLTDSKRGGVIN